VTLILRETCQQARIEGLNPGIWDENDFAVIDAWAVIGLLGSLRCRAKLARVGAGSDPGKAEQAARKRALVQRG
jgi:hypothetical protein